ncbi:hypothetical protein GCM10010149_32910 [Nonomuraea roseoviolacea subsp. roseoviolacea]|uniref:Uncharacterized protein n=1 Tax=Nonomuraea roseoviolacea subsp. carminata TaxID=160689 RepID=A0ABT1K2F3_9ACTN|nr:hypothetical protein [Nonomuraea roseoviolacea subsp. carminata]
MRAVLAGEVRPVGGDPVGGPQLGERLALAQVNQHQQGLLSRVEQPPGRLDRLMMPADHSGDVDEKASVMLEC